VARVRAGCRSTAWRHGNRDGWIQRCRDIGIQASEDGLQLVHPSAKDYFESLPLETVRAAHLAIARICVQFLSFDVFASGPCHTGYEVWLRLRNYPFVWYAAHYWGDHVRRSESEELDDAIVDLLRQPLKVSALVQFMLPAEEIMQLDTKYWSTISDTSDQSPSGVPGLHVAARLGLTSVVKRLLGLRSDQNFATALCSRRDGNGRQAVYWAVRGNQEATLRLLLNSGADINDSGDFENYQKRSIRRVEELKLNTEVDMVDWDVNKRSALHLAILQRNAALAEVILEMGADVDNENASGLTPFQLAIEHLPNSTSISLLAHGARIWLPGESGRGILTIASIFVKVLTDLMLQVLKRDLSISEKDAHGCIMMLWTTEGYLNKTAQRFLEWQGTYRTKLPNTSIQKSWVDPFCGVSPDTWQAFLLAACESEDEEMVRWLLAHSQAALCTIDLEQWTIAHLAASSSDLVLDFLILNNTNLQARDREGHTILHLSAKKNNIHLVELAVTRGRIPVDARTQTEATPLHLGVGSLHVLELLISHGADINAVDNSGRTPLYYSLESESAMEILLSHGATIDTFDNDGMALICHAVIADSASDATQASSRLRCLLQAGAEVNFKGSNGSAAIHTAAFQGYRSLIQLLLENGADPTMEDLEHRTPLALLESSRNGWESKDLLLSALRTRTSMGRTSSFPHRNRRR
jgi:ankyrin repeat protein